MAVRLVRGEELEEQNVAVASELIVRDTTAPPA
jgi:hypothetical protein